MTTGASPTGSMMVKKVTNARIVNSIATLGLVYGIIPRHVLVLSPVVTSLRMYILVGIEIPELLIRGGARINRPPWYSTLDCSLSVELGRDIVHPHDKETFMPKVLLRLSY